MPFKLLLNNIYADVKTRAGGRGLYLSATLLYAKEERNPSILNISGRSCQRVLLSVFDKPC